MIPSLAIASILLYALYHTRRHTPPSPAAHQTATPLPLSPSSLPADTIEAELKQIGTMGYRKAYIVKIIAHGSSQLHFKPDEVMDAGFASREETQTLPGTSS